MQTALLFLAVAVLGASAQLVAFPPQRPTPLTGGNCRSHLASVEQQGLLGAWRPRCEADGSYSSRQVHASTGMAFCVDPAGVTILAPAHNIRACECPRQRARLLHTTSQIALGQFLPRCETDGTFSALQIHASTGYAKCFTEDGQEIMSGRGIRACKCPRERFAALNQSQGMVGRMVPQCDATTGAYNKRQSHPSTGYSWCVDEEGQQVGDAVPPASHATLVCN
ncbi:putative Equistatin [Hypsibius exemplaris]|uniref:Equistatin n=1 Tax=Hypsibius exemplaris TaxID=2072580 RepID=A0A1W0X2Q9_HYPEX|nr:putative Equistatin [Hypsibius exemplaris]